MKLRKQWSDKLVVSELRQYIDAGHMPTCSFLRSAGRNDLGCQISRRGGWKKFAALLGIEVKPSDTATGWVAEEWVQKDLTSRGYAAERQTTRAHFDILLNGILRIDVKGAGKAHYGCDSGWHYRMGKIITADVVICNRMDCGDCYIFPWFVVPSTNLTIVESGGKYEPYHNNYAILDEMIEARRFERAKINSWTGHEQSKQAV